MTGRKMAESLAEPEKRSPTLSGTPASCSGSRVKIGNLWLDPLTERQAVDVVRTGWAERRGGSVFTVNVDIMRATARHPALADLIVAGSLVVADGMPLVWAARASGTALPERVCGSSLIFSLSEAAAAAGRSAFVLGGAEGVPESAAEALQSRWPQLRIAGADSPPFGFDLTDEGLSRTLATVVAAGPDLVFVGLGFPRQEKLIEQLRAALPHTWFLACGGAIPMAAGVVRRASPLVQRIGLEWAHRMLLEPKRLAGRYLRDDLPFVAALLARSSVHRLTGFGQGPLNSGTGRRGGWSR